MSDRKELFSSISEEERYALDIHAKNMMTPYKDWDDKDLETVLGHYQKELEDCIDIIIEATTRDKAEQAGIFYKDAAIICEDIENEFERRSN